MKYIFFILAVVLWVGAKSKAASAKKSADLEDASDNLDRGFSQKKSAFESLFNEFMGEEAQSDDYAETQSPAVEDNPYEIDASFEETVTVDAEPEVAVQPSEATPLVQSEVTVESTNSAFDLRQAVIYQTILSNKYLDEIHSIDN